MANLLFKKIADMREADSLITQLRRRRFVLFRSLLDRLPQPVRLLDVGGTHFFFPGFQFLPLPTRIWLLRHFDLGWYKKIPDYNAARREVETIRLLSRRVMARLFPEGTLHEERFAGLTVSFVVYAGWSAHANGPKAYADLVQ